MCTISKDWDRNRLLKALTPATRSKLQIEAVQEMLALKTVLYVEDERPKQTFFPLTGLASVVAVTADGRTSEVGFIGCEGLSGAYHLLGTAAVPNRCFVQIKGDFLRIPFSSVRQIYETSEEFRRRVHQFVQVDSLIVSQMAGCNQMHQIEPRLARWLLMADDRQKSDTLAITHDILSEMVAATRSTVTQICVGFKRKGLIRYSRGEMTIADRRGLESLACDCYRIARRLFTSLYQR